MKITQRPKYSMTETKTYASTSTQPNAAVKKLSRLKLAPRKMKSAKNQDAESSTEVKSIVSTSRSDMTSSSSGSMIGAVRKRHQNEMTSRSIASRVTSDQLCASSERYVTYDQNSYKKTPKYFIPKLFEIWAPQLSTSYRPNVTYVPTKPSSFASVSSLISRLNMPVKFKTAETVVETCVHFQKSKYFGK